GKRDRTAKGSGSSKNTSSRTRAFERAPTTFTSSVRSPVTALRSASISPAFAEGSFTANASSGSAAPATCSRKPFCPPPPTPTFWNAASRAPAPSAPVHDSPFSQDRAKCQTKYRHRTLRLSLQAPRDETVRIPPPGTPSGRVPERPSRGPHSHGSDLLSQAPQVRQTPLSHRQA